MMQTKWGVIKSMRKKNRKMPDRTLNIWNTYDFKMSGLGAKSKMLGKLRHVGKCLKWSKQRIKKSLTGIIALKESLRSTGAIVRIRHSI